MVDELGDGVDPYSRLVIEAAMEASNFAMSTNGEDLEVMMRITRDTALEAHEDEGTPRQRLRFRAKREGCGIWQRLTGAEMRKVDVANVKGYEDYDTRESYRRA